jgi:hypothetical protein
MALTYVYATSPNAIAFAGPGVGGSAGSNKSYTANAAGIITGVTPADAQTIHGVADAAPLQLMCATGATGDRPPVALATGGAFNNANPPLFLGMPYHDTTLAYSVFYAGTERSTTGWVDRTGAAA